MPLIAMVASVFDAALRGFGGCPMAKDDLTGNIANEHLLDYLDEKKLHTG